MARRLAGYRPPRVDRVVPDSSAHLGPVADDRDAPDVFVRTGRQVFVSWTIPAAGGGESTLLLDLVEWAYPNGRSGWDNEREVMLHPNGTVWRKAPTERHRDVAAEEFPDPIEAIGSGAMVAITRDEFDRYWNAPALRGPGLMAKLRSFLRNAR